MFNTVMWSALDSIDNAFLIIKTIGQLKTVLGKDNKLEEIVQIAVIILTQSCYFVFNEQLQVKYLL